MDIEQNKDSKNISKFKQLKKKCFPFFHLLSFFLGLILGIVIVGFLGLVLFSSPAQESQGTVDNMASKDSELMNIGEKEQAEVLAYLKFKEIKKSFTPSGIPDVYGQELDISFDAVQEAINKVAPFGPTYGEEGKKIILTGADLERYINIGSRIACEYCCGVKTLVRENGEAACGCAHSQMMRGLAAYLIQNHPELSDEQILEELSKWKITYFPKQTLTAKLQELQESGEPGIKEILEEFPEFLPQMVGGC